MSSNLSLWNAVCVTDPEMTTRVSQRGGFTAIDAYYTVQRLTEQFGPLGTGWGWTADFHFEEGAVVCLARFWYIRDGKCSDPIPILTMNKLAQGQGIDEDAGKKALTDAITKWASYLGFSADVFLGKFDDNKYVESIKKLGTAKARNEKYAELKARLEGAESIAQLNQIWTESKPIREEFAAMTPETADDLLRIASERKNEILEHEKKVASYGQGFMETTKLEKGITA